jgi:hypothetical protein
LHPPDAEFHLEPPEGAEQLRLDALKQVTRAKQRTDWSLSVSLPPWDQNRDRMPSDEER